MVTFNISNKKLGRLLQKSQIIFVSPHEDDEKPQLGFELFQPGHSRQRNENEMTLNDDNFSRGGVTQNYNISI